MKKVMAVTIVCLIGVASIALADDTHMKKQHQGHEGHKMMQTPSDKAPADTKAVYAGNKTCPISGEPVNGTDYVEYKGKKYGICCPGCDKEFLKDPEKYLKILREKGEIK